MMQNDRAIRVRPGARRFARWAADVVPLARALLPPSKLGDIAPERCGLSGSGAGPQDAEARTAVARRVISDGLHVVRLFRGSSDDNTSPWR